MFEPLFIAAEPLMALTANKCFHSEPIYLYMKLCFQDLAELSDE